MNWDRAFKLAARYWNWEPHSDGQRDWIMCDAKNKIAACGRRWGKSESTGITCALEALATPGSIQFILAPTDDQTKVIMREISRRLRQIPGASNWLKEWLSPYHQLHLKPAGDTTQGSVIQGRTVGITGRGLRSNKAHKVVLDEAGFISEDVVMEAVRPLLADYDGQFVAISTPKGRNWFYRMWHEGQGADPRYKSFRFSTADNPHLSREWLADERARRSERVWQQEYCAEFLESEGQVFRGVQDIVSPAPSDPVEPFTIGIDLAKTTDWTVLVVLDATGRMMEIQRWNRVSWPVQITRIVDFISKYKEASVRVDATGVGDPIYDQLRVALPNRRIHGLHLNSANKEALIENLAMCIETQRITILPDSQLVHELMCYGYEQTAGLHMRYNAPDGEHDDCVIALALAAWDRRAGATTTPMLISATGVFDTSDEFDNAFY